MNETYTFTARQANRPERVATFTLDGDQLHVSAVAEPVEQVERIAAGEAPLRTAVDTAIMPAATWTLQKAGQTFHVTDVEGDYDEQDGLSLRLWVRSGGLRVLPLTFHYTQVDNPDAAQAFVAELEERTTQTTSTAQQLPGLLDYWLTWIGVGAAAVFVASRIFGDNNK